MQKFDAISRFQISPLTTTFGDLTITIFFRNMKLGANSTWNCTKNLERTGNGCTGMKVIQKRLLKIALIMTLLKKMI